MIPIVFWASFEPWLNAMNAAEITCSRRNRSLIRCGFARRKTLKMTTMNRKPIVTPAIGERTRGSRTFWTTPSTMIADDPIETMTAPRRPPIRA